MPFLSTVRDMPQRNLAVNQPRRLLASEIRQRGQEHRPVVRKVEG